MNEPAGARPGVAVLGTGIMGGGMAASLVRAGLPVRVWNRTAERAEPLGALGAQVAGSPADAVRDADAIVTMLADAAAVEAAMVDGGAAAAARDGAVWLQMSTVGVRATRRFARLAAEHALVFVDAPVLGTRQPAAAGELTVLASGPEEARPASEPVFSAVAAEVLWLGEAGRGTALKLVVNQWLLSLVQALADSLALAEGLGLDPRSFLEAIEGSGIDVPYAHLKGPAMLEGAFDASFPLRLAEKDLRLVLEAAEDAGVELALAEAVRRRFQRAIEQGHGDDDIAAVYAATGRDGRPAGADRPAPRAGSRPDAR